MTDSMVLTNILYNSNICRLCCEESNNIADLFINKENEINLSEMINTYLPVKVSDDGEHPRGICPGCSIQIESTKFFFELIISGQKRLRELMKAQREIISRGNKQKKQLEEVLKCVNPTTSVQSYAIQSDEQGDKFLIQIFSEGPLFGADHDLRLQIEGLTKSKKKRGRPPKSKQDLEPQTHAIEEQEDQSLLDFHTDDLIQFNNKEQNDDGRKKRKIRVPSRFSEAIQGKELDKIFKESEMAYDKGKVVESEANPIVENNQGKEAIGHLESPDGKNLGTLYKGNKMIRKRKFFCNVCQCSFFRKALLMDHSKVHDAHQETDTDKSELDSSEKLEGEVNDTSSTDITVDDEITSRSTSPKASQFQCEICDKSFTTKQNHAIHMRVIHEGLRSYKCQECRAEFPYPNSLKLHQLQHKRKNMRLYKCPVCKKYFNHPSSLHYHKVATHGDGRRFVCAICNKSFKHQQLLQKHRTVHSDTRPFNCLHCNASFKTRANLLGHAMIHSKESAKRYCCTEPGCNKEFIHRTSLSLHLRTHSGLKPYTCDVCQKSFYQKGNLLEHRRIHTGEKPYKCNQCDRSFTTSSQYHVHSRKHSGERPFKCDFCGKTFFTHESWKCHYRRHLNIQPFSCTLCSKSFSTSLGLKKHERVHSGYKPYTCDKCGKAFSDMSNLTRHRKLHDNEPLQENRTLNLQPLLDEAGQPISLKTIEGQEIQVVKDNEMVHGLLPDGTLIPIDISIQESISEDVLTEKISETTNTKDMDETNVDMSQLLGSGIQLITQGLPDESGGMCLLTTYDVGTEDDLDTCFLPRVLKIPQQ